MSCTLGTTSTTLIPLRRMATIIATCALLLLLAVPAFAQNQNNVWYFGDSAGVDFNTGTPVARLDGALYSNEAASSISNPRTGKLLFYTDGITIWNANHRTMPNGFGLTGHTSITQGVLIVPIPGDSNRYYVFVPGIVNFPLNNGLKYSIVDMRLDGGRGDVEVKNVHMMDSVGEGMTGLASCGEDAYWLVTHGLGNNIFHAWKITRAGIEPPVLSAVGSMRQDVGCFRLSRDGRSLVAVHLSAAFFELFDFDQSTGRLSAPLHVSTGNPGGLTGPYGACFSPSGRYVYVSTFAWDDSYVTQYDLSDRTTLAIQRSAFRMVDSRNAEMRAAALQFGPGDRIYGAFGTFMSVIDWPDERGLATGVRIDAISLKGRKAIYGLPNFIDVSPTPFGPLGDDAAMCRGDTIQLITKTGARYRWQPAAGLSCVDCSSPFAFPDTSTMYTVIVESAQGCAILDSIVVTVRSLPVLTLDPATAICVGEPARLRASGASSYRWSPSSTLTCDTCSDPIAQPAQTTTYLVRAMGVNGCERIDSVKVVVHPAPTVNVGPDATTCSGSPVVLKASDGVKWQWTPAAGLSCTTCRDPLSYALVTTTYTCTITDSNGCVGSDSVVVFVRPKPFVLASADTAICAGESVTLHVEGGTRATWSPRIGLSCADCNAPIATPDTTTTYYTTVVDEFGCSAIDSVTVTVAEDASVDAGPSQKICDGDDVRLNASNGASWQWSPANGLSCIDCRNPIASPTQTTVYSVVVRSRTGCYGSDTTTVSVNPIPDLSAGDDVAICVGGSTTLKATGAASYVWSPALGLSCDDCSTPSASPIATTTYVVAGLGVDGCTGHDTMTVNVSEPFVGRLSSADRRVELGTLSALPIALDTPLDAFKISSFELIVSYDRATMQFKGLATGGTLTDGWTIAELEHANGSYRAQLTGPTGAWLRGSGELVNMMVRAYLGTDTASWFAVSMSLDANVCASISGAIGRVLLDSICGLSGRLIEFYAQSSALGPIVPNPFNPTTTIHYVVPVDGAVRLTVYDARGSVVARLVDGIVAAGAYTALFDATLLPSGVYRCSLDVGGVRIREQSMMHVK